MGKQKKKPRGGNKKKRGGGGSAPQPSRSNRAGKSNADDTLLRGDVPAFDARSGAGASYQSLYTRYKSATERFLRFMKSTVPEDLQSDNVSFLLSGADWMAENETEVPAFVLADLRLSIRMRKRVAKSFFDGGDGGHKHFLEILVYCYSLMQTLPRAGQGGLVEFEKDDDSEDKEENNRFDALQVDLEDDEDEEDDEDMFPSKPVPRPEVDLNHPITFEDLMASDDRLDTLIFLDTLDRMMMMISLNCNVLLDDVQRSRRIGLPASNMVEKLLELGAASNMAIKKCNQLETELEAQHPHLSTPYRVIAVLVFPHISSNVSDIVEAHASKKCTKEDIIAFLGDAIECSCRNPSDEFCRRDTLVSEFCASHQIDTLGKDHLDQLFEGVYRMCIMQFPVKMELASVGPLRAAFAAAGEQSEAHSWLSPYKYIGQDRSIHHTLRLLQLYGGVVAKKSREDKKIEAKRGSFGSTPWVEGRVSKIQGEMDELLMADILPSWTVMCRHGIVGKARLPMEAEISPLFVSMRNFIENPSAPISWGLVFGVHAMLTSVLEVKRELSSIARVSKQSFKHFFAELQGAVERAEIHQDELKACEAWKHNSSVVLFLENYARDVFEERALWNPVCAGTTLLMGTYLGNLEAGCAMIDCRSQLRIVLFMYHGLLIRGLLPRGQIPLLDQVYDAFKNCKAIWSGSLPVRGELVKKFWISQGMSLQEAKFLSERTRVKVQGETGPVSFKDDDGKIFRGRRMVPIEPAEISTSYRRICQRDFSDVVDKYHSPEQKSRMKGTDEYELAVCSNDTLDAIESEQVLLSLNLPVLGQFLELYVSGIANILQWTPILKKFKVKTGKPDESNFLHQRLQS